MASDIALSRPDALAFRDALTQAVQTEWTLRRVLSDSGFDTSVLPPGRALRELAGMAFDELASGAEPGYYALLATVLSPRQYPRNFVFLELAVRYAPELILESSPGPVEQELLRHDMPGPEVVIDEGAPTFVDVVFLAQGVERARSVCRLVTWFLGKRIGSGTGFRIGPNLILTCHHILFDWETGCDRARSIDAWFNYEVDEQGRPRRKVEIPCDPESIVGEREQDWAVIRALEEIPDGFPALRLGAARVPAVGDRVSIIQHPRQLPKKVAFQHNVIRAVKPDRILYWTDTDKGSSGSPVFDQDWGVVAIHHWTIPAPAGERSKWWNQGRRIDRLIERMNLKGIDLPAAHTRP